MCDKKDKINQYRKKAEFVATDHTFINVAKNKLWT